MRASNASVLLADPVGPPPFSPGEVLHHFGAATLLGARTLRALLRYGVSTSSLGAQLENIGLGSLSVATLTAVFASMVMELQFSLQLARFGARDYVVAVVSLSMLRELGPVLTAILVGARAGSGMAAELGAMSVSEQLDAMRTMGADPIRELVVPRALALVISLPLLCAFAETLGIAGAMGIARVNSSISASYFFHVMLEQVTLKDWAGGLFKTIFFAIFASAIACREGLDARGGTAGVGRAVTRTVVSVCLTTLIADFVLTNILLGFNV